MDSKLKLILGLIWTLILHYSISMPMWDGEEPEVGKPEQTPKQRLMGWVKNKVGDKPITNFTTDWNDGIAVGALVDSIAPGTFNNLLSYHKCATRKKFFFKTLLIISSKLK